MGTQDNRDTDRMTKLIPITQLVDLAKSNGREAARLVAENPQVQPGTVVGATAPAVPSVAIVPTQGPGTQ